MSTLSLRRRAPALSALTTAILLPLLGAALALPAAHAAEPLFKPGLWEIANKAGGASGGQMNALLAAAQQQMAAMDPAQRSKIEAVMAKNGVVIENGAVTAKACISPAMAARGQMPVQQKGACTYRSDAPSGNSIHYAFSCTNPVASGEGTAVFSGGTSYTASTAVRGGEGGEHAMTIESSGRWLGSDCGNIAPAAIDDAPAPKANGKR